MAALFDYPSSFLRAVPGLSTLPCVLSTRWRSAEVVPRRLPSIPSRSGFHHIESDSQVASGPKRLWLPIAPSFPETVSRIRASGFYTSDRSPRNFRRSDSPASGPRATGSGDLSRPLQSLSSGCSAPDHRAPVPVLGPSVARSSDRLIRAPFPDVASREKQHYCVWSSALELTFDSIPFGCPSFLVSPVASGLLAGQLSSSGSSPLGFRLRAPSFNVVGSGCLELALAAPFAFNRRPASRI